MNEEQAKALRRPFPDETIGKLPRLTCSACREARKQNRACDRHSMARCDECGAWGSTAHIHLDYVGHAATTDRLLQVDPMWTWEPWAIDDQGLPAFDKSGGLWIRLTVAGVTRLGYGDADGKLSPKEAIGDAIRNAAMRFGVALDLWSKEDLKNAPELEPAPSTVTGEVLEVPTGGGMGEGEGTSTEAAGEQDEVVVPTMSEAGPDRGIAYPGEAASDGTLATGEGASVPPVGGAGPGLTARAEAAETAPSTSPEGGPGAAPPDRPPTGSSSEAISSSQTKQLLRHAAALRWTDTDISAVVAEAYPGLGSIPELNKEQARALIDEWGKIVKATRIQPEQRERMKSLASTADTVKRAQVLFGADQVRNLSDLTTEEAAELIADLERIREEQRGAA